MSDSLPPHGLVHGILQARVLEWVVIPFSRGSSQPWWFSWSRNHLQCRRSGFDPWVGTIPWGKESIPAPVFWPGEFHGLYSPWGRKEWDTTKQLSLCNDTEKRLIVARSKLQTLDYKINPRYVMYSMENIVNNTVLYTWKLLRENILKVLITNKKKKKCNSVWW